LRALQLLYYYLGSLLLKILEENPVEQGQVNLNRTNRAHACDVVRTAVVARRPATIRRHAEVPLRPPVRAWCLGHCGNVRLTWSRVLGRCHAFRLHTLAGGAAPRHRAFVPPAHRLPGRRTCAMPRPMPDHVVVVTYARTTSPSHRGNKRASLLPFASSRAAAARHCHPASKPPLAYGLSLRTP
jgi:hypothetical protein